jgi:hypothetical protein
MTFFAILFLHDAESLLAIMTGPAGLPLLHARHPYDAVLSSVLIERGMACNAFQLGFAYMSIMRKKRACHTLDLKSYIASADNGPGGGYRQEQKHQARTDLFHMFAPLCVAREV